MNDERNSPGETPRIGWREWLAIILCALFFFDVVRLIYNDHMSPSSVSNRSFFRPALGIAGVLGTYAVWRFRPLPLFLRVLGWLFATVILYLGIRFALILLNASIGELFK